MSRAPGWRHIVIGQVTYEYRGPAHAGTSFVLRVRAPSGASFESTLWAKIENPAFTPADARTCIEHAIRLGWSPLSRLKRPLVVTAPDCADYGPMKSLRRETRWPEHEHFEPALPECCLVCHKQGQIYLWNISAGGKLDARFDAGPWRVVKYLVDQVIPNREDFGVVCSEAHEAEFYKLVRRDYPSVYDRLSEDELL